MEAPVVNTQPAETVAAAPVKEEKSAFDIKISAVDAKAKIKVIKEVRSITGLGLKEVIMGFISYLYSFLIINEILYLLNRPKNWWRKHLLL